MTFEELLATTEARGEPLQAIVRKQDGSYQASVRSSYDPAKAFGCDSGATPVEALANLVQQRRLVPSAKPKTLDDML